MQSVEESCCSHFQNITELKCFSPSPLLPLFPNFYHLSCTRFRFSLVFWLLLLPPCSLFSIELVEGPLPNVSPVMSYLGSKLQCLYISDSKHVLIMVSQPCGVCASSLTYWGLLFLQLSELLPLWPPCCLWIYQHFALLSFCADTLS